MDETEEQDPNAPLSFFLDIAGNGVYGINDRRSIGEGDIDVSLVDRCGFFFIGGRPSS